MMDHKHVDAVGGLRLNVKHKVHLAIDQFLPSLMVVRWDGQPRTNYYHYNKAFVKMSMGSSDKHMYPMVNEALQNSIPKDKSEPFISIVFNGPDEKWQQPPNNGNHNDGNVRIRVDTRQLLQQFVFVFGAEVKICIERYLFRRTFRGGQHFPLRYDNESIVLDINPDGTTNERTVRMAPGLLGLFELSGKFSVALEWNGPNPVLNGATIAARDVRWSDPDYKIKSRDKQTFSCHSHVLCALSPIFELMLRTEVLERSSKEIFIGDEDGFTIMAFLKYAYEGSIHEAYANSALCFKLFTFSHKYGIEELEQATCILLKGKTEDWFSTKTALQLYCYLGGSLFHQDLAEKTWNILVNRQEEVPHIPEFPKLASTFPVLKEAFP